MYVDPGDSFGESPYQSSNGFTTTIFGPPTWMLLHMVAANFPLEPTDQQRSDNYNFVVSLLKVLPCGACRQNAQINLRDEPFTMGKSLKNRISFMKWAYDFHNAVNRSLGKTHIPSFKEAYDMYELFRAVCDRKGGDKSELHAGCNNPVHLVKSRCLLSIVPRLNDGVAAKKRTCSSIRVHRGCIDSTS